MSSTPTATDTAGTPRAPGRPRDASRDPVILDATVALIAERGFSGLRIEDVAATAGASKATIYRRWPSREALVAAALDRALTRQVPGPDTGSLRADLLELLEHLVAFLATPDGRALLLGAGQAGAEPARSGPAHTGMVDHRLAMARQVLTRAAERGEIAPGADLDALATLPPALVFFRVLLTDDPVDHAALERLVDDLVLPALVAAAGRAR